MAEDKSKVLYAREAYHTLIAALEMWAASCAVALATKRGGTGLAPREGVACDVGEYTTRDLFGRIKGVRSVGNDADADSDDADWFIPKPHDDTDHAGHSSNLIKRVEANVMTSDNYALGNYTLITLDAACEWFTAEWALCMRKFNFAMLKRQSVGRPGRFRAACYFVQAQARQTTFLELGLERLGQVCLSQKRRPRGLQVVQTTKRIDAGYYQSFEFNGKHAMRLPPGRPAMSEAEWRKRNDFRNAARRKTDRRRKPKHPAQPPKTKHGRPSRELWHALRSFDAKRKDNAPVFESVEVNTDKFIEQFAALA